MKWSTALPAADDDACVGCGCPCPGAPGSFAGAAVVSGLGSPPSAARRSSRDLPALRTALSRVSNSDPVASVACFSSAIAPPRPLVCRGHIAKWRSPPDPHSRLPPRARAPQRTPRRTPVPPSRSEARARVGLVRCYIDATGVGGRWCGTRWPSATCAPPPARRPAPPRTHSPTGHRIAGETAEQCSARAVELSSSCVRLQ